MFPKVIKNYASTFDRYVNKALAFVIQKNELSKVGKMRVLPKVANGLSIQSLQITNKVGFSHSRITARDFVLLEQY